MDFFSSGEKCFTRKVDGEVYIFDAHRKDFIGRAKKVKGTVEVPVSMIKKLLEKEAKGFPTLR